MLVWPSGEEMGVLPQFPQKRASSGISAPQNTQ
jgi:hypothetical protein